MPNATVEIKKSCITVHFYVSFFRIKIWLYPNNKLLSSFFGSTVQVRSFFIGKRRKRRRDFATKMNDFHEMVFCCTLSCCWCSLEHDKIISTIVRMHNTATKIAILNVLSEIQREKGLVILWHHGLSGAIWHLHNFIRITVFRGIISVRRKVISRCC